MEVKLVSLDTERMTQDIADVLERDIGFGDKNLYSGESVSTHDIMPH